jgi:hypothetical protein
MADIQKITADLGTNEYGSPNRAETGVVQFNDDYPGVFIRGDNALMHYAYQIRVWQRNPDYVMGKMALDGLLKLLESCDARTLHAEGKL